MRTLLITLFLFAGTSCKTLPTKVKSWRGDIEEIKQETKDYQEELKEAIE